MELSFRTRELRSICEDKEAAARLYDAAMVRALHARLADLRAADSLKDLVAGHPRLTSDPPTLSMDVTPGCYLVCRANHPRARETADDDFDWDLVRRLQVIEIKSKGAVGA